MNDLAEQAIKSVKDGETFCRFITANDTGVTDSHQSGFYIPKTAWKLFFDQPGERGSNKDHYIKIKWQGEFETDSRAIYYGVLSRNEYRLTRFNRGFPFLRDEFTGSLLIITKQDKDFYTAFILSTDRDINTFLDAFGMSPTDTGQIITKSVTPEVSVDMVSTIKLFAARFVNSFPDTENVANEAFTLSSKYRNLDNRQILLDPDKSLLDLLDTEYEVFKEIENVNYVNEVKRSYDSAEEFIKTANTFLNRRKSRAGRSLEHHLDKIFKINDFKFSHPGKTEENKEPDFLFPGSKEYKDVNFPEGKLTVLAAKTTCKDRWRQILNEADRIKTKHLFTLQQGISRNQLGEMAQSNVQLIVPKQYVDTFPVDYRDKIDTLGNFIRRIKAAQS